jgi:hypothetical protein
MRAAAVGRELREGARCAGCCSWWRHSSCCSTRRASCPTSHAPPLSSRPTAAALIPQPCGRFVGRIGELAELKQKVLVNQDCQSMSVVGLGGTGRTPVAQGIWMLVAKRPLSRLHHLHKQLFGLLISSVTIERHSTFPRTRPNLSAPSSSVGLCDRAYCVCGSNRRHLLLLT